MRSVASSSDNYFYKNSDELAHSPLAQRSQSVIIRAKVTRGMYDGRDLVCIFSRRDSFSV
jgi:hypothetical protein